jgi:hypothetical protein
LFGIVFGLIRGNSQGWTSAQVLTGLVGGTLLIAAFVAWESRAATPMMPLSLFRSGGFKAANATMLLTNMGMFGVIFLVSQFLQSVLGYTPLAAGVHGLPWTAAPAVTAPVAGLLSDRLGGRRIVAIGVALQAIGIGWLATVITPRSPTPTWYRPSSSQAPAWASSSRPSPSSPSGTLPENSRASPPAPPTRCARSARCWALPCSARSFPPPAAWTALASSPRA